jgi:hypothetical protein
VYNRPPLYFHLAEESGFEQEAYEFAERPLSTEIKIM